MPDFKNWDPGQLAINFKGVDIQGFAEGTMVQVARDEDTFTKVTGAQGDTTRTRSRNKGGKVTITLLQASPTNGKLSTFQKNDERLGTGVGPLLVKDLNGLTLYSARNAWLTKPADAEFAKDPTQRVWVFDCAELQMFTDGAVS